MRHASSRHPFTRPAVVGLTLAVAWLLPGCGDDDDQPSETTAGLANPASVYCEEQGGEVEIVDESGGQVGYCLLPDGTRIEEWELYRSRTDTTEP